jgi:porin
MLSKGIRGLYRVAFVTVFTALSIVTKSQDGTAVDFSASSRFDFISLRNPDLSKHFLLHGEIDAAVSISTENLRLFKGGEFYSQVMGVFGNKASSEYSGDLQVFSNIESDSRLFLYQCYYKQTFGKFILKLGQMDMNADFCVSGYGSSLVNSSFGVIPTISLNMPVSIFSYLSAGISLKYLISPRVTLQTAFFDGDPGDYDTNRHNLNWRFNRSEGFFNISEIHYKTKSNLRQGKYKAGLFYHSKSPGNPPAGGFGYYIMGDQQITSEKGTIKNGLSIFFELSSFPSDRGFISSYYAFGLIYRGIFHNMNEDECTFAVASAYLGRSFLSSNYDYLSNETALEFTYKKFLSPNFIIQPDMQYIINCGSSRLTDGNAFIGLLRAIMLF